MGIGTDLRDDLGFGGYVHSRILPLAPSHEQLPFRGRTADGDEALTFIEETESRLLGRAFQGL